MNAKAQVPQYELLINGKWVKPKSGKYSTILNPATEEVIAYVAAGDENDVDTAAKAARAALKVWNGISAAERGRILNRFADLLEKNQEELILLESVNAGKPISSVRRQDMPAAIDTLRYYAGWTDKIIGQVIPARTDALTYTVREPVGVVGAIVPWNFPIMIGIWKIAPALACGCTLIVKPAELTPMTAIRIGELALEAGIPPGVLNIVTGKGSVVGDAMVAHPQVDKITFTGSPKVGRGIMQGALKLAQARLSVATLDQLGAAALYGVDPSYFDATRNEYRRRRDTCYRKLLEIPGIVTTEPQGAFYTMAKLPVDSTERFQLYLLQEFEDNGETVMFAPGSGFYATPGAGTSEIRIAYVRCVEELERSLTLLRLAIERYNQK